MNATGNEWPGTGGLDALMIACGFSRMIIVAVSSGGESVCSPNQQHFVALALFEPQRSWLLRLEATALTGSNWQVKVTPNVGTTPMVFSSHRWSTSSDVISNRPCSMGISRNSMSQ